MNEGNEPQGKIMKPQTDALRPLDNNAKAIIAGTGAMVVSFFLPWIDVWVGSLGPSSLLKVGADGIPLSLMVFLGTFILAAGLCFRAFAGEEDTTLTLLVGALPFVFAIWTLIKLNAGTLSALPIRSFAHLTGIASYGMLVYFAGAAVTLFIGWRKWQAAAKAALEPATETR